MVEERYKAKSYYQALAHMMEEGGEMIAASGKTFRWGPDSFNPELSEEEQEKNIEWLRREWEDLIRAGEVFWKFEEERNG